MLDCVKICCFFSEDGKGIQLSLCDGKAQGGFQRDDHRSCTVSTDAHTQRIQDSVFLFWLKYVQSATIVAHCMEITSDSRRSVDFVRAAASPQTHVMCATRCRFGRD